MKRLSEIPAMRRTAGVVTLLVLLFGAVWLVWNGYDGAREQEQVASEPAHLDGKSGAEAASAASGESATPSPDEPQHKTALAEAEVSSEEDGVKSSAASEEKPASAATPTSMAAAEAPFAEKADTVGDASSTEAAPEPAAAETTIKPSFDVVRVEPSGETVIAGLAKPKATVEVLDGADPLAKAEANERGEWALVLDEPLPPGSHDLAIRTTSPDRSEVMLSDQRIAVSVPENADEEPLVVLNAPDAPSRVVQVPPEQDIASAVPEVSREAAPALNPAAPQWEKSISSNQGKSAAAPTNPDKARSSTLPAETETTPAERGNAIASQEAAEDSETKAGADIARRSSPSEADEPEQNTPADHSVSSNEIAPEPDGSESSEQTEGQPGEVATTEQTAPSGDTLSESDIAAAPPEPETSAKLDEAAQARLETAESQEQGATDEAAGPPASMRGGEPPIAEQSSPTKAEVAVAAVEAETDGTLYIAGMATADGPVRVYVDDEFVGEATPSETGTWLIETERELPEGTYSVRADQVGDAGAVVARAEVPFERRLDVAVLNQTSDAAGMAGDEISGSVAAPATVIIKRGDNLWRISRSIYGRGIRYSTIYRANQEQIRDPDLIYPGQVFILPSGDTSWQN